MKMHPEATADRDDDIQLSRRVAALHIVGVVVLVLVVVSSVVWISVEHNRLARRSSERLIASGIGAALHNVDTLVRDYSIWDEAFDAARVDDRDWLYHNIGNAVTDIGTLDLIHFHDPATGAEFGWRFGSPRAGETGLLSEEVVERLHGFIDTSPRERAILADIAGDVWALSVSAVRPVGGLPDGMTPIEAPRQIHGLQLSQERLDAIARSLLIEGGIELAESPGSGQASLPLLDGAGETIAYAVWETPRPGARILRSVALPLSAALGIVAVLALLSGSVAVRSARRLELALAAAREADRMKSEFLSNVTHELRTPMNGILGVAQLLELTPLDLEQRGLLRVLETSAQAQMALIGDLLDFARLEAGQRPLDGGPFLPVKVLEDIGAMIAASVTGKNIAVETDWSALDGVVVRGDARAFRQIVTNLMGNAVKFTPEGRVAASAALTRSDGAAQIVVEISDTGVGIAEAELERIFERFYRVDGTMARATDGAGLGLSISQRLAALMGGAITVESVPGEGSTFRFSLNLPLVQGVAQTQQAA